LHKALNTLYSERKIPYAGNTITGLWKIGV